ncbi:hypothetical protein HC174_00265 [Salinimicrobium sp. CDJ15-81-2]|uniref:Uncharacterized conserved protein YqgV, UPF0045/DUF77 family n=1 Tax=Salinimicrobium sediminis TaxID=1343891 RepID=A0A285X157_9FLAO|nr:YkoF family thiamine/hydroxymethylpyrimidine-binding protein [Salinimicrobium sediminis]MDX1603305.1 YkoF family thiamine/hydroxymethylpyrimidine-binding protein [Salinimicrobium sediminis]MDX1753346.1 YkoF family thiamine/hydroxymethylpyrimidine-binding protein [Salinimicrobium sediminis]NJY61188.1 hypothetical protein [Salinimicrobium nanhaiense]SOC79055.1 Uncharacterized conserved protein YqgV, UPF0045/DUF77 family [Salinimicrobium sediminis]
MQISAELALTPLQDDFEAPVKAFIKKLRSSGLTVMENPLSTQIYGDYDKIMEFLTEEVKEAFQATDHVILTIKLVKGNRSDYAADF